MKLKSETRKNISDRKKIGFRLAGSSGSLLVLILLVFIVSTYIAFMQKPRPNPNKASSPIADFDWWRYPIEKNARGRLPIITGDLNTVFVLPGTDKVWVAGDNGTILHSPDEGYSWRKQTIETESPAPGPPAAAFDIFFARPVFAAADMPPDKGEDPGIQENLKEIQSDTTEFNQAQQTAPSYQKIESPEANQDSASTMAEPDMGEKSEPPKQEPKEDPGSSASQTESGSFMPNIESVFFIDDAHGWAVGEDGTILANTGDDIWRRQDADGSGDQLMDVYFTDIETGWAVGANGAVFATTDGSRWTRRDIDTESTLLKVHFNADGHGCIAADNGTIFTTSNGEEWETHRNEVYRLLAMVHFIDTEHGWAVGKDGSVYETKDGREWQRRSQGLDYPDKPTNGIYFRDDQNGWMWDTDTVYIITDGGKEWPPVEPPVSFPSISDIKFSTTSRGWAVGEDGVILMTENGGLDWDPQTYATYTDSDLFSISINPDTRRGLILGNEGFLLETDDTGRNWQERRAFEPGSYYPGELYFDGENHGWIAGNNGTVLTTLDGGRNWREQKTATDRDLYGIYFLDNYRGWCVGAGGTLLKTVDGGRTWILQALTTENDLYRIFFADADRGWISGQNGTLLATVDGNTWQAEPVDTYEDFHYIQFIDTQTGLILGEEGTLLGTGDGGRTWNKKILFNNPLYVSAVCFTDRSHGWIVGNSGTLLKTVDGGRTWNEQITTTRRNLYDVQFIDAQTGWISGEKGTLLATADGGQTWQFQQSDYRRYPAPWYWLGIIVIIVLGLLVLRHSKEEKSEENESIADILASDRPLRKGDPDPLHFGEIARGLSRFIRNPKTEPPMTIAVTGAWGTGKSSLMNLLYDDLKIRGFTPVWFNAWHHQKGEQLLASLFANIRAQVQPGWTSLAGINYRLRLLFRRSRRRWILSSLLLMLSAATATYFILHQRSDPAFLRDILKPVFSSDLVTAMDILVLLIGGLPPLAALFRAIRGFGLNPARLITTVSAGARQTHARLDPGARFQLSREFEDVTASLDLGRMVIFIDDLDRCSKENVLDVLESINFLASSGNCYIVVGMAKEWVKTCVGLGFRELATEFAMDGNENTEHKESSPGQEAQKDKQVEGAEQRRKFANDYLEKLINIEVPIPVPSSDDTLRLLVPEKPEAGRTPWHETIKQSLSGFCKHYWPGLAAVLFIVAGILLGSWESGNGGAGPEAEKESEMVSLARSVNIKDITLDQGQARLNFEMGTQAENRIGNEDESQDTAVANLLLRIDKETLQQGLVIGQLGDDKHKADLILRAAAKPDHGLPKIEKTIEEVNINPYVELLDRSIPYFHPGNREGASRLYWSAGIPILILFVALLVTMLRRSEKYVDDSREFREALTIWHSWIIAKRHTPRAIKRFVNRLRYIAMRCRREETPPGLRERIRQFIARLTGRRSKQVPVPAESEDLDESLLVALGSIYYLESSWVVDKTNFEQIKKGDLDSLLKMYFPSESDQQHTERVTAFNSILEKHRNRFTTHWPPEDNERSRFLEILAETDVSVR